MGGGSASVPPRPLGAIYPLSLRKTANLPGTRVDSLHMSDEFKNGVNP